MLEARLLYEYMLGFIIYMFNFFLFCKVITKNLHTKAFHYVHIPVYTLKSRVYPVKLSASTQSLKPYLVGLSLQNCLIPDRALDFTIRSSTATF